MRFQVRSCLRRWRRKGAVQVPCPGHLCSRERATIQHKLTRALVRWRVSRHKAGSRLPRHRGRCEAGCDGEHSLSHCPRATSRRLRFEPRRSRRACLAGGFARERRNRCVLALSRMLLCGGMGRVWPSPGKESGRARPPQATDRYGDRVPSRPTYLCNGQRDCNMTLGGDECFASKSIIFTMGVWWARRAAFRLPVRRAHRRPIVFGSNAGVG